MPTPDSPEIGRLPERIMITTLYPDESTADLQREYHATDLSRFAAGFAPPLWPTDPTKPKRRAARQIAAGKARHYFVAARFEPDGDLRTFGERLAEITGGEANIGKPKAGDRAAYLVFECVHRNPQEAIDMSARRANRWIKKTGRSIRRVTWDVKEVRR